LKLVIQIPAYNEEKTLAAALAALPKRVAGFDSVETLVIDDGSSDSTVDVARRAGADHVVRLLNHRGLATAFTAGIDASLRLGADVIVNTDADNQYEANDIPKLVAPIVAGRAEVVIGDRNISSSPHMSATKKMFQRIGSRAVSLASGVDVPDVTSGMRAFSRDAAFQINVFNPFTYTLETIIQAGNRNLRVDSVAVRTNPPTRESRLYRGMATYIRKSLFTIFRIYALYKPLKTFALIGALLLAGGFLATTPFLRDYFTTGRGGHIQSLILAAILSIAGFQTLLIALVTDLISVNRRLEEEILVRLRKIEFAKSGRKQRPRGNTKEMVPGAGEEPPLETEWIWLVDEAKLDEQARERGGPSSQAETPQKKKRKRRRTGARQFSEPRGRHGGERDGEPPASP
jgi:glycosyltransferase involved in cell wall biosynthesis